jgi:dTDP-4-dehydrorhamnose reductase
MLGRAAVEAFRGRFEIHPASLDEPDIRDAALVAREIRRARPAYVLHLAAMTDVDACELDPEAARLVNVEGTRNVALAARECGAAMVYLGTGMVYDGRKDTPYVETDPRSPVNEYGRSKLAGELVVKELVPRHFVFYACWLFGGGAEDKKFVAKLVERARRGGDLPVVNDKFGSPTYTRDLARAIRDFIGSGLYGTYHCANVGCVSRFEMAEEIVRAAGIADCRPVPISSDAYPLPAPRPRMEALRNMRFEQLEMRPMRDWREALDEYVRATFR